MIYFFIIQIIIFIYVAYLGITATNEIINKFNNK